MTFPVTVEPGVTVPAPVAREATALGRLRLLVAVVAALVGLAALLLTAPEFTGDAPDYARDVADAASPTDTLLFEPGHLVWRPLGYFVTRVTGDLPRATRAESIRIAQHRLTAMVVPFGVVAVMALAVIAFDLSGSVAIGITAGALLATSSGFLNYGQAGSSYIPGMCLILLGIAVGWRPDRSLTYARAALAGGLLALGVMLWLPYVLSLPAALLGIWVVARRGRDPKAPVMLMVAVGTCAVIGLLSFAVAAWLDGVTSLAAFRAWVNESSHGITSSGLKRVVLGFPQSFVYMENGGRVVNRYLSGDPFYPVTRAEVLRLQLWPRMAAFYVGLAVAMALLLRQRSTRALALLLALAAVPTVAFAIHWMGSDVERYFPAYPFLLLLLALAAVSAYDAFRRARVLPALALAPLGVFWLLNLPPKSNVVERRNAAVQLGRLACLVDSLDGNSVIVLPGPSDPLWNFNRNELDLPPRATGTTVVTSFRTATADSKDWRELQRSDIRRFLAEGRRVFAFGYALEPQPPKDVNWLEGEDRFVRWAAVREEWSRYTLRPACAGGSGVYEVLAIPGGPAAP